MSGIQINPAGIGINKVYGARSNYEGTDGRAAGVSGITRQAVLEFNGEQFDIPTVVIPKGATIRRAVAVKVTAATVGNADNVLDVGVVGSEDTNRAVSITGLATTGTVVGTLAGTLTSPLAADTTIGVEIDGTTPAAAGGKYRVFIEYDYAGGLDGL